ncbi:MAG TPA: hypothetical protein VEV17_20255 [Bryobacteraceae bacterium]|nr:hypothetical protein [Bryobacteraceae bacterium]
MNRRVLLFLLMIAGARMAPAQLVSFGVTGGVPFLDRASNPDESRPYVIGPSIEFRVPAGFALEASALYQRIGGDELFQLLIPPGTSGPGITFFSDRLRGNSWEFPLLVEYYFRPREATWQPFIGTGWAFRVVGLHQAIIETTVDASGVSHPLSFSEDSRADAAVGAVFSAGLRYRAGRVALIPEVRYTRWGSSENLLRKNEAAFLLGVRF